MKNRIALFALLINFACLGQGLNGELGFNDDYSQQSQGIVAVNEFSYFMRYQSNNSSFFSTSSLEKIDTLGNALWSSSIYPQFAESIHVFELIPSENGGVYLLGHAWTTCDVSSECFWFMQKYDANGVNIWTKIWNDADCYDVQFKGLSLNATNEVFVNYSTPTESKIYTFSIGGLLTDSLEINQFELEGIGDLNGVEKIAFKQDSLFGFDINGSVSGFIGFSSTIRGINVLNDTLFVLTSDSIHKFDASFQQISGTNITGYSDYSNLKISNNKIEFLSSGSTDQFVISLDHQFALTNVLAIPVSLMSTDHKDFSDSHFATSINFSLTEYTSIRHLDFSRNSTQNSSVNTTDIGIIDIQATQITVTPSQSTQGVYQFLIYADVLLKNYGNNTLFDCRINHLISQGICGMNYFTEHFSNLNLAPNDSMWVSLGLMHNGIDYFPSTTIEENICVYTSHPNFKTDLNVPNDQYCKNIFLGYTDLDETSFDNEKNSLTLAPNPVESNLEIIGEIQANSRFVVSDQHGKTCPAQVNQNQLDVSNLPSGVYVFTILNDSINHLRFIKL